jgi:putative ABC transport system permease protein
MDLFNIVKLAFNGLKVNKGRSFLTMLGIIIGVASVIIIISAGAGAQSLIYQQIESLGSNLVAVVPGGGADKGPPAAALGITITTLKYEDAKAFISGPAAIPHMLAVTAYARGQGSIAYQNKVFSAPYNGVMASYPNVINHKLDQGRFFNEQEEKNLAKVVVLGSQVKEELFGNEDPLGKVVRIRNERFKVIGFFQKMGVVAFQNIDDQVYLPIKTTQKILLGEDHIGFIRARIDNDQFIDQAMEDMRRTLRFRHGIKNPEDDDFSVLSSASALQTISSVTDTIKLVLAAVAAISLVVGGIGIMNIMLVVVAERTREIGLRKAIGARPRHIMNQFLVEAIFVTVFGGIIGILIGIFFTTVVALIVQALGYAWELSFSGEAMLVGLTVSSIIGLLFGYYPAKKAAYLNAIEALRYE